MHWRQSRKRDDPQIIELCAALFREDPSPYPDCAANMAGTLAALRAQPLLGQVLVLADDARACGYALLVGAYSNELGGQICWIDELCIAACARGQGYAQALLQQLGVQPCALLHHPHVAVQLEVTPNNNRARALYTRAGFRTLKNEVLRMLPKKVAATGVDEARG